MKHYVITRMAIPDEKLFDSYFSLFVRFYVPSIKSQKNQNFTLFIVAEKRDHRRISDVLEMPNLRLLEPYHEKDSILFNLTKYYDEIVAIEKPDIQTRHDCDDCMREDYIDSIQSVYLSNIDSLKKFLIFAHPNILDIKTDTETVCNVYSKSRPSMFLSVCQKDCSTSVMADTHSSMNALFPVVLEIGHGYVTRIQHGENLTDKLAKKSSVIKSEIIPETKVTVITSIFGNLEIMKECMETWFPLMPNWEMVIYDQKVSRLDGTDEYVREMQNKHNFTLITDEVIRKHPDAINFILKSHVKTDWVLHLDSDVKLLDRKFYSWVNSAITNTKIKVYGAVEAYGKSKFKQYQEFPRSCTLHLPRAAPYVLLFSKKYMDEKGLDFSNTIIENGTLTQGTGEMFKTAEQVHKNLKIRVTGDTAWKLYCESNAEKRFEAYSRDMWLCWEHKAASSRTWYAKHKSVIMEMKNVNNIASSSDQPRIAVYTCITGDYDALMEVKAPEAGIDYICFSDKHIESETWDVRSIPTLPVDIPKEKIARYIKMMPHLVVGEYETSVWVDGNIEVIGNIREFVNKNLTGYFSVSKHPRRTCIYKESVSVLNLRKESPEVVISQMLRYRDKKYPENNGLIQSGIILRKHNKKECRMLCERWWNEILQGSKRDQLSFNYAIWNMPVSVEVFEPREFSGNHFQLWTHGDDRQQIVYPPDEQFVKNYINGKSV